MRNIVITGAARDDPTALTAAIIKVLSKVGLAEPRTRKQIEDTELRKAIGVAHVPAGSESIGYEFLDAPWTEKWGTGPTRAFAAADSAILVSSPLEGAAASTEAYLQLISALGATRLWVFLNQPEYEQPDPELAEVSEMELADQAMRARLPTADVFVGSAAAVANCSCSDGTCQTCQPVLSLFRSVDAAELPDRDIDAPARMLIEHVYERVTLGQVRLAEPVPFGLLAAGTVRVGDSVEVVGGNIPASAAKIKSLQVFGESRDHAEAGQIISALLADVSRKDVRPPRVVCKAGTCTAISSILLELDFGTPAELLGMRGLSVVTRVGVSEVAALSSSGERGVTLELAESISAAEGEGAGLATAEGLVATGRVQTTKPAQ